MPQKILNYILRWYLSGDQKNFDIHFWKLDVFDKLKEQSERKNNITLIISENVTTIYDDWFYIIEKLN